MHCRDLKTWQMHFSSGMFVVRGVAEDMSERIPKGKFSQSWMLSKNVVLPCG